MTALLLLRDATVVPGPPEESIHLLKSCLTASPSHIQQQPPDTDTEVAFTFLMAQVNKQNPFLRAPGWHF